MREIRGNPRLSFVPCGFIDDDPNKHGLVIQGIKVIGSGERLQQIVRERRIDTVLIAMPSTSGSDMTRILRYCFDAGVSYKTVPGFGELIESNSLAHQIRDVAVEDLLGRKPVRLEENQIRRALEGKVVMVTGAAGSIGSELCRQIARFHPAGIVGFEIAETPLFEIDREMRQTFPRTPFYPEIGNVQNRTRLDEVLRQCAPKTKFAWPPPRRLNEIVEIIRNYGAVPRGSHPASSPLRAVRDLHHLRGRRVPSPIRIRCPATVPPAPVLCRRRLGRGKVAGLSPLQSRPRMVALRFDVRPTPRCCRQPHRL